MFHPQERRSDRYICWDTVLAFTHLLSQSRALVTASSPLFQSPSLPASRTRRANPTERERKGERRERAKGADWLRRRWIPPPVGLPHALALLLLTPLQNRLAYHGKTQGRPPPSQTATPRALSLSQSAPSVAGNKGEGQRGQHRAAAAKFLFDTQGARDTGSRPQTSKLESGERTGARVKGTPGLHDRGTGKRRKGSSLPRENDVPTPRRRKERPLLSFVDTGRNAPVKEARDLKE